MSMTPQERAELKARLLGAYGVQTVEQLKQTPAWAAALKAAEGDALKAMDKMFVKKETVNLEGWYLNHATFTEWNESEGEYIIKDEGPAVLLSSGEVKTFWTGEKLDAKPLTPVRVGPLHRIVNLQKNTVGKSNPDDNTAVKVIESITAPLPELNDDEADVELLKRSKKYGTIYGETKDYGSVTCTITLSKDEEDIQFFAPRKDGGNAGLYGVGTLPNGKRRRLILNAIQAQEIYGLDDSSDPDEYKAALVGEKVIVHGQMRIWERKTREAFEKDGHAADYDAFMANAKPFLVPYKDSPAGGKLLRLDMNKAEKGEAQSFADGIEVGSWNVMDVKEEKPGEFALYVLAVDRNAQTVDEKGQPVSIMQRILPIIDCVPMTFDIKQGKNKGGKFTRNQDAFVVYLNHIKDDAKATRIEQDFLAELVGESNVAVVTAKK